MYSLYPHGVRQPSFSLRSTSYLREDLERLQKRAMKIIYPELSDAKALELSELLTLYEWREAILAKVFGEICANQFHSLHKLLASMYITLTSHADYIRGSSPLRTSAWEASQSKLLSERTQNINLFVHSAKLKDARIVFF